MKKILVTGGAGFIGSAFVRLAVARHYRVAVLDSINYAGDQRRLKDVARDIVFYKASIDSASAVDAIIRKEKPAVIVHFAAETHVDRSIIDAGPFLKTNILGTENLLQAARKYGPEKFVHISTDEVYGEIAQGRFLESSPFRPNSPYAVSKAAADMLVSAYARTYGLPVNIIRPSNNYGPWQYPEKLLPVVIYRALHGQKVPVYGRGANVREWFFVDDCARAVLAVMEKGKAGEAYNAGSGVGKRNIDVVKAVLKMMGKPASLIQFVQDRPGHDLRYSLDGAKIQRHTGWKAQCSFDRGLAETVAWYTDHRAWLEAKAKGLKAYWAKIYR